MENVTLSFRFFVVILLSLIFFSCSAKNEKSEITVTIPVVHNPKRPVLPQGIPPRLIVNEELSIGYKEEDKGLRSYLIFNVEADEEGNIYILDFGKSHVKVFDKNGQLLRTIGGKKQFNQPSVMHLIEGKRMMICDFGNIYFYTLSGKFLKKVSQGKYSHFLSRSIEWDSRGNIVASLYDKRPHVITRRRKIKGMLSKFDQDFKPIKIIGTFEESLNRDEVPAFMTGFRLGVRRDDSIVWALTTKYELQIVNGDGMPIKKIIKDYDPVKITEEDKKEMIEEFRNEYGDVFFATYSLIFPEYYPPLSFLVCDDGGRIYIKTYEKNGNDRVYWDVFDPEGSYITKFSLPKRELIWQIKDNFIYTGMSGTKLTKKRNSIAKRYRMEWE
jgi:hypothetical protein